jgi:hypothetical protein
MVHHGLFGMSFDISGIDFRPLVPSIFNRVSLGGFRYREMELDLEISGSGSEMASFALDGRQREPATVPLDLAGKHTVSITMRV